MFRIVYKGLGTNPEGTSTRWYSLDGYTVEDFNRDAQKYNEDASIEWWYVEVRL